MKSACAFVSTPSAVISAMSALASETITFAITDFFVSKSISSMMLLSIFILLKGTMSNRCNDEYPLPKSSMAIFNPNSFNWPSF